MLSFKKGKSKNPAKTKAAEVKYIPSNPKFLAITPNAKVRKFVPRLKLALNAPISFPLFPGVS
jgi:hypothetical protein